MVKKEEQRGFSYQKRSKETLKERANMRGGNFDTIFKPKFKQWKPKDGKNLIRILPPTWAKAPHYGLDIFVNYSIGADNQSYLSLSKHGRGDDPLAEAKREAQQEGDKKLAKALNPTQRILYWIIDRNDEDEGPLLWAAPFTFDKSLSNLCIDEDTKEVTFIDNPVEGRDVRFYKSGNGLNTKYDPSKMKVLGPSSVHEDEGQEGEWLDFINEHPLPDVLNFYDYEHIKASFDGQAGWRDDQDEDEDDEGSSKPARRKTKAKEADDEDVDKPVRHGRAKAEDEDEDDKPARSRRKVSEEDDEAEEKPRSRRRPVDADDDEPEEKPKRTRAKVSEPEDDDEDEKPKKRTRSGPVDDDDEDDAPPPKSRRGKSDDDDEEGGGSLRERLAARRRSRNSEDDD